MKAVVQPYLTFSGRCEEALEFYTHAIDAKVELIMRYNESPEPMPPGRLPPGFENKVMHSSFWVGESRLMASDGCDDEGPFQSFSLSFIVRNEADAERAFQNLSEGGKVTMPLAKTFWSPSFGMLVDKFGVKWLVMVNPSMSG